MRASFLPRCQTHGSVLIIVLWSCLALVSLTLLFGHSSLMTYRGADNGVAGRQAEQAVEGGARYAISLLTNATTPGLLPEDVSFESEALPVGEAIFWLLGRSPEVTDGSVREFGLVDESGKLDLNRTRREDFLALPGMTEELAAAIKDWRDADDEVTPNGAESEIYLQRQPPYRAKNAPFESIEELALVNGADRVILYGEDTNLNGVLDSNENDGAKNDPPDNSDGKLDPGILEWVTVHQREPNKRSDGTARVDVRQPGAELDTLLAEVLGASRAAEIRTSLGPPNTRFGSVLEFYVRSAMTEAEFGQISGSLSTAPASEPYIFGKVNVNTASEAVLACIPGIGLEKASDLVAARRARAQQDTNIAWVTKTLEIENARRAGPFLTGQSWQVTADVAAVGRHGRGYRRTRFLIDASTGTPRIIYRRNLAVSGWALGDEARLSLADWKEPR